MKYHKSVTVMGLRNSSIQTGQCGETEPPHDQPLGIDKWVRPCLTTPLAPVRCLSTTGLNKILDILWVLLLSSMSSE